MSKYAYSAIVSVVCVVGCSLDENLYVSGLAQGSRHHELIERLEGKTDRGERLSTFHLYLLCHAYFEVRRYDEVIQTCDRMDKSIAAGHRGDYGSDMTVYPHVYRAKAYLDLGDYGKAIEAASMAYGLLHQENRERQSFYRHSLIEILGVRGIAHALQGNTDEAHKDARMLKQLSTAMSNLGPQKQGALAMIHVACKEFTQALAEIRNPEANVGPLLAMFYDTTWQDLPKVFILHKCLYETGRMAEAKEGYDKLLKHAQIGQLGGIHWVILFDRARIARVEGDLPQARDLLRRAVDVIELQRSSIDTETGRIGFVGDKQDVYVELVSVLVAHGSDAEAFAYAERAKARALVDMLSTKKQFAGPGPDDAQRAETLLKELQKAEKLALITDYRKPLNEQARTRAIHIRVREKIQHSAPELASLVTVTPLAAGEIQQLVPADDTLVEYFGKGDTIFAFVVTRQHVKGFRLAGAGLADAVRKFRSAVADPKSDWHTQPGRELYSRLVAPLAKDIRTRNVTVVPHGPLHYVPFAALPAQRGLLIDQYHLRMLPSASVLRFLKAPAASRAGRLLALGNPDLGDRRLELPFAEQEALAVARGRPNSKVFVRRDATETALRRYGAAFRYVHCAMHGKFYPEAPLRSALLMAPDAENDGTLTVGELYNLRLNAELVTLSACETGLGKTASGDDVVGLIRGFLYAGARSIVSSLWEVDDQATRILMEHFYASLEQHNKRDALRDAQLKVKNTYNPHPYYWAAFQITGKVE